MRRRVVIAALGSVISLTAIAAPVAQAASGATEVRYVLGPPSRTVIDNGPAGASPGDITVSTGDVIDGRTNTPIGFYTTNQVTVRVDAANGRELRDNAMSLSLPGGVVTARGYVRAPIGRAPLTPQHFAVLGGTGRYEGASGEAVNSGFTPGGSVLKLHLHPR